MDAEADSDYIDANYIWQRRVKAVDHKGNIAVKFPNAAALGVEFNPAFERAVKIPTDVIANGAILDIHCFVRAVKKTAYRHYLDIVRFNFDLGMEFDSQEEHNVFAHKLSNSVKALVMHFRQRPKPPEKMEAVFRLPEMQAKQTDLTSKPTTSEEMKESLQSEDVRRGRRFVVKRGNKPPFLVSMKKYPMCKNAGVTFVLRSSNAPVQKLDRSQLKTGMMLEIEDFVDVLRGQYSTMLRELVSHNFGNVFDRLYLAMQVKTLHEQNVTKPSLERAEFLQQPFKFMVRQKREFESTDEIASAEKRTKEDLVLQERAVEEGSSYMCPVDFDADLSTEINLDNMKCEDATVEIKSADDNNRTLLEEFEYPKPYHRKRKQHKGDPTLPISAIFSDDTLPMSQKTVKQREWALRTNRIKDMLNKETQTNFLFTGCREVGLNFNVGSGRAKNLDMQLLNNQLLFEIYKFAMSVTRSVSYYVQRLMDMNFNYTYTENFPSYLYGKERMIATQINTEEFLNMPVHFPEIYTVVEVFDESSNDEEGDGDNEEVYGVPGEYPYCEKIGVNPWSLKGRRKKLRLEGMTHGALLEIFSMARRLCSHFHKVMNDVLEHNFAVDLQDPASDEAKGLREWLSVNKLMLKKVHSMIRNYAWLSEIIDLKNFADKPSVEQIKLEPVVLTRVPKRYTFDRCKEIGLDLDLSCKSMTKVKLDPNVLTRRALFEVYNYVTSRCSRYVPALYEILDYNFDLSSQRHRRVEFAWCVGAQVMAMARKGERGDEYMDRVFELPFEPEDEAACKSEEEEREIQATDEEDEVTFVKRFIPVDIDVEIE